MIEVSGNFALVTLSIVTGIHTFIFGLGYWLGKKN